MLPLASGDLFVSLGGILTGIAEILTLVGTGIGFLIRSRRNARRERLRTETAAGLAAQEAKKQLEERLELQHTAAIDQYKEQLEDLQASYERQLDQYRQQVADLTHDRDALLSRLLDGKETRHGRATP